MAVKSKVRISRQDAAQGRLEDGVWMLECGETNADAIAQRIGFTDGRGVRALLRKHDMYHLADRLFDPLKHARMGGRK